MLAIIALIGGFTALFAATMGVVKREIKQVLAYSTISQYGYMMLALGSGGYVAATFHLMTHAFFKALLFLGAGSVIIAMHHNEDMWDMGGLKEPHARDLLDVPRRVARARGHRPVRRASGRRTRCSTRRSSTGSAVIRSCSVAYAMGLIARVLHRLLHLPDGLPDLPR